MPARYAKSLDKTDFPMAKEDYIMRNRQWLAEKAAEPGVNPLDKGVCYKV